MTVARTNKYVYGKPREQTGGKRAAMRGLRKYDSDD